MEEKAKVIPFPSPRKVREIDWEAVETARASKYRRIPKKMLAIIRKIFEAKQKSAEWHIIVHEAGTLYTPNPIPMFPSTRGIVWMLDLLDRFGGDVSFGRLTCTVRRKEKRKPVFLITEISESLYWAICDAVGGEFEHFLQTASWQMIGKELPDVDLMAVLVLSRQDDGKRFLGLFDRGTILSLFGLLGHGLTVEQLLSWGL